ncbi:MAG: 2Fe-2S iron-sulfur cluster-binding protein [Moraxella sp.]|uniref:2Fe-2S iron-sulfur cluster-binding protein n=1 Tax=Moraxella sp. TaxID=479 RepID=UPI0026DADBDF|nr:2Fe-2S iron-sulfur cluster-binding protein [Moraxella sp.]MDO4450017.1 2Fe-2S iron-sulfur cluster-binding protein [Moraxella sp.]
MSWVFTDEMRFYLHEGETLLDGMIRTEHKDVRYMCRQGYCGACKMKVRGMIGQVSSKQTPLAQLNADEVLACCCMPMGAMAVGYDDVGACIHVGCDSPHQHLEYVFAKCQLEVIK